jgi:hypothetical protein
MVASYYPQYSTTIFEVTGIAVSAISARWLILWRKWTVNGSPERRKTDLGVRVKSLEKEFTKFVYDRHRLREDLNKILGDVQVDVKELMIDVKTIKHLLKIDK